jgi:hypothetical protein
MKTYIIYEIKCNDVNVEFNYVGHTINFRVRKNSHKQTCNRENGEHYNYKIYKCIRENGGWDNWSMCPLEEYECESPIQARIREQYWLDIKQSKLNSLRAYTSLAQAKEQHKIYKKQYKIDNKEIIKEKDKQYYIDNKEVINEQNKQYRTNNKDNIKAYNKQYASDNKEAIKESKKQKYINNKEAILERQKQIIICKCGVITSHHNKSNHIKTKKHLNLMAQLNL